MIDTEFQMIVTRQEHPEPEYFLYELTLTSLLRLKQAIPKKVRIDYDTLATKINSGLPYDLVIKILKYVVVNLIKDFKFDDASTLINGFKALINDFYSLFYDDARKTPIYTKMHRISSTFKIPKMIVKEMLLLDTEVAPDNMLCPLDVELNYNFPVLDIFVPATVRTVHPYHCIHGQSHIGEFIALMGWQWVRTGGSYEYIETFAFKGTQANGIWKVKDCAWPLVALHLISEVGQSRPGRRPDTRSWTMIEEIMRLCCGDDFVLKFI